MNRALRMTAFLGSSLLLSAGPLLAQETGSSPADSTTGWVFRWVNFSIAAALIVYGFYKAGPYFHDHAEDIAEKIAEGARAREAGEKLKREAEARLAGLDALIAEMRREARRDADAEAVRLRALAKEEAHKIEHAAQVEIAAAERAARYEVKILAARMAGDRAEMLLRDGMTPQSESALFRDFVAELDRSVN